MPLVLLLSFIGSSRTVYADQSYNTDYSSWYATLGTDFSFTSKYIVSNPTIVIGDLSNDKIFRWYYNVDFIINCNLNIPQDKFNYKYAYTSELFSREEITFNLPSNTGYSITRLDYDHFAIDASYDGAGYVSLQNTFNTSNPTAVFFIDYGGMFKDRAYRDNRCTFKISFQVEFYSSSGISLNSASPLITISSTRSNQAYWGVKFPSDNVVLEDIDYYLKQLHNSNGNIVAAIQHAESQAAYDADIAQSQAADIIDDINYDHSGTSQTVSATQSAYDAAQGAADAAVDSAVHNYTSDLSTVEAYDYSSFFTSQRNSAVFWRDVGEYILDSSNLGFVSGSIIIVTLIGLVIFMLRL